MRPILVIGASIAGLVYATNVARRGFPVHVFERKSDLAKEPSVAQVAYDRLLQDGPRIRMADVAHSVRETHLHGPHGATLRLGAPAYILDRRRLDPSWASRATAAGANLHFGVKQLSFVEDRSVIVDGERFDGSLIVFADGARTNALERMPSMLEPERVVWGASSTVPSGPSTDAIHIHVGPHAPGGRTQWTPLGQGRWAFWSFHGSTPDEALANHRRHLESVGFDPQECTLQAVHPDPVYTLPGTLLGPGCIAIGGAAGQGGLEMGMVCGLLAAKHTVRASTNHGIRASKLAGYQHEFDARYRPGYLSLRRVTDALTRMDAATLDSILAAPRGRPVPIDWVQDAHRGPVQLGRAALRVLRHIPQPARVVPRITRQVSRSLLDSGL